MHAIVAEWARQELEENFSKDYDKLKVLYTTRGLRECVANSLTRAVLYTSLGTVNLVRLSCEVRRRILFSLNLRT